MARNKVDEAVTEEDSWSTVTTGIGKEWDLEGREGPIITGAYLGTGHMEVDDTQNPGEKRDASFHQIIVGPDEDVRFIWGSYEVDKAFDEIEAGQIVRVTFLGRDQFSSDDGPRTIKNYKVQVKN